MTINIDEWLNLVIEKLQKTFSEKLLCLASLIAVLYPNLF